MVREDRKFDELRKIKLTPHFSQYAEGSVLIELGNTKVLCNTSIQEGVPAWIEKQGLPGGWVTCEYAMLPRATHHRTQRETHGLRGRTHEIKRMIGRSLRASVDLLKIGKFTYIVDCDVLQADGGTRTVSITGGYISLALSINKMIQKNELQTDVLLNPVAAISAGIVNGRTLLDLCYGEDMQAQVDANIVMNSKGEFIEIQYTAEKRPFSRALLDNMLDLAWKGISELFIAQQSILNAEVIVTQ